MIFDFFFQRPRTSKKSDDQPLKKCNINDYFEIQGVPDSKPICPMPQCKNQTYKNRSNLLRHLKHQHKVSQQYLDELKQTIPTVKEKIRCLICGWVGLITNRPAHLEKHIRQQEKEKINALKAAKEAKAVKDQETNNISR